MLTAPLGIPGYHLTDALSKLHPKGASVASLRLFTTNRNGVHVRRNTQRLLAVPVSARRGWDRLGARAIGPDDLTPSGSRRGHITLEPCEIKISG